MMKIETGSCAGMATTVERQTPALMAATPATALSNIIFEC
jgi:hypothetical protein